MDQTLPVLLATALLLGITHTLIGPDHYLPFIVLGRAGRWSLEKTLLWTFVCGVGHVGSSVLIGALGIALGWGVAGMEGFEGIRGEMASFALMGFGGLYMLWGIYRSLRGRGHGHAHAHVHEDGSVHTHLHAHERADHHHHDHQEKNGEKRKGHLSQARSFWAIFIIFVLGPCEPLIPLLMVPATIHSLPGIAAVTGVFAAATIGMMMLAVTLGHMGLKIARFGFLEKHVHALSGGAILVSGLLIQALGI